MKSRRINTQNGKLVLDSEGARICVPCRRRTTDVLTFGDWGEFEGSGTRGWDLVLTLEGTRIGIVDVDAVPDGSQSAYRNDEGAIAFVA